MIPPYMGKQLSGITAERKPKYDWGMCALEGKFYKEIGSDDGEVYILAQIGSGVHSLVGLHSGNRFSDDLDAHKQQLENFEQVFIAFSTAKVFE